MSCVHHPSMCHERGVQSEKGALLSSKELETELVKGGEEGTQGCRNGNGWSEEQLPPGSSHHSVNEVDSFTKEMEEGTGNKRRK